MRHLGPPAVKDSVLDPVSLAENLQFSASRTASAAAHPFTRAGPHTETER